MIESAPLLSIAVITYNHARWIGSCLDGIAQQQISFSAELVIGDDASSDGTSAICAEFVARTQSQFAGRLEIRDRRDANRANYESVFMPNVVQTLAACRGKYVAIVEGDDFWTDPSKLETQVQYLEAHPDCDMVIHNATLISDSPAADKVYIDAARHPEYSCDRDYSLLDWPRVSFPSCSIVVRREVIRALVETGLAFGPMWDSPLLFIAGTHGRIHYLNRAMGCYRIHTGGCWNGPLAGDRYEVIMRLAARLQRHIPGLATEVRQWLQTLFDFNYCHVARRSESTEAFQSRIGKAFPQGTDDLHLNAWLARSAAEAVLNHVDDARRLRESTSFRLGHIVVEFLRAPIRGLNWLKRTVSG